MEEKSCSLFFLLGSGPAIVPKTSDKHLEKLTEVLGKFDSLKINVGRLGPESFRLKIQITRSYGISRTVDDEVYYGIIGDTLHLLSGVKMKLACYYQDGTHESDFEWEPCLKITFFR